MEVLTELLYSVLSWEFPRKRLRLPAWVCMPSPMVVFAFLLFSYFLVTGGACPIPSNFYNHLPCAHIFDSFEAPEI